LRLEGFVTESGKLPHGPAFKSQIAVQNSFDRDMHKLRYWRNAIEGQRPQAFADAPAFEDDALT
jgi:hypothetical protein